MVTYETEFKEEAVKLANQLGAAKAAKNLGIPVNTLYTWISRAKTNGQFQSVGKPPRSATPSETTELLKRIKELEKSNRILQDALRFFVVSQK